MLVFLVSVCVYKVVVQLYDSFFSGCCSCVFLLTVLCVLFLPHCFTQTWVKQYFFIFPILEES